MDKLFLEKFRELNCQKKYIIDNDSLSICEGNIILPNGYYIGGYFSYKTYIVDSFDVSLVISKRYIFIIFSLSLCQRTR